MKVLDLFAGKGGWSQAFRDRGHDVTRVEIDERYEAERHADILDLTQQDLAGEWDIVLASPPCERFSIASHGTHWEPLDTGFAPRTTAAIEGTRLALHALYLINSLQPKAAIMENPRGLMRKILPVKPLVTVWYCRYGDLRAAKPTDLWLFGAARSFYFEPECSNKRDQFDRCGHARARRGAKTGTQANQDYWTRSLIPYGLSLSMCEQMEQYLAGELVPGRLAV